MMLSLGSGRARRSQAPRMGGREFLLVSGDRLLLHHRQANVVETLDQAPLAEFVELESDHPAIGAADFPRRQVNGDGGVPRRP